MSPADSKQGIGRQNVRMFKKGIKHANPSPLLQTQPSAIPHLGVAFVILCGQIRPKTFFLNECTKFYFNNIFTVIFCILSGFHSTKQY